MVGDADSIHLVPDLGVDRLVNTAVVQNPSMALRRCQYLHIPAVEVGGHRKSMLPAMSLVLTVVDKTVPVLDTTRRRRGYQNYLAPPMLVTR